MTPADPAEPTRQRPRTLLPEHSCARASPSGRQIPARGGPPPATEQRWPGAPVKASNIGFPNLCSPLEPGRWLPSVAAGLKRDTARCSEGGPQGGGVGQLRHLLSQHTARAGSCPGDLTGTLQAVERPLLLLLQLLPALPADEAPGRQGGRPPLSPGLRRRTQKHCESSRAVDSSTSNA